MYQNKTTQRLNKLLTDSGLSQEQFAKHCDLSLAALKNYLAGRTPNTESLLKICKACSVSADWLLGLSDVRKPSADLRAVCEYTGMSEDVIKRITDKNDIGEYIAELNHLIEIPDFYGFIKEYRYFLTMLKRLDIVEDDQFEENENGKIVLNRNASVQFVKRRLEWRLMNITDEDYYKQEKIAGDNTIARKLEHYEKLVDTLQESDN